MLSAFSPNQKPGQRGPRRLCYEARRTPGGISAARTVGRFSAESRHRSHVPSLIKVPVFSPFRVFIHHEDTMMIGVCFFPVDRYFLPAEGLSFPFRRRDIWQKMRSGSLAKPLRASPVCVLCRCCRAFPFHNRARIQPDNAHPDFPVFPVGTPAVAGAIDMQLKQTDAMKNHQFTMKLKSSFAADTFHRFSTSLAERFTMGLHGASRPGKGRHGLADSCLPPDSAAVCA